MISAIEIPEYLPDQNHLYAYYLTRCGVYRVGRPNRYVLELLEEDIPSRFKRLKYEAKLRGLEDWMDLEEIEGESEERQLLHIRMLPLSKRRVFRIGSNDSENIHLGSRGMMAVLDVIALLPLVEKIDLSNISSWYTSDVFPAQRSFTGNDVIKRLCEVARSSPSLSEIDLTGQPIGTLAAHELLELCQFNKRIVNILFSKEGVDHRLCNQLERILARNRQNYANLNSPIIPSELPLCLVNLPRIDRKTLREQQVLRGMLESDDNFCLHSIGEDEIQQIILNTRVMSTAEVVSRCAGRGLRGDGEFLYFIKTGKIRAFINLEGILLQRGDYFGEQYDEVLFSTCSLKEEQRGMVYALPLASCKPIIEQWEDRLESIFPIISKAPLLQPLTIWCHIRICTCCTHQSFQPGELVIPVGETESSVRMVQRGVFYALPGSEADIDRTGRTDPYPFSSSDFFGVESIVARKKCASVAVIAGKEKEDYSALLISGFGLRLIASQLFPVLVSLVRPYSVHEDVGGVSLSTSVDDVKVHYV